MTQPAYDPESSPPPPPPPPANRCTLCDSEVEFRSDRCPSCGLWKAGHGEPAPGPVLWKLVAVFAALYVVALLIVAVAR